ncbi:acyltransferase family protein [Candidatus Saccharibacteria bacterium]|nr:acyltransferase family protein [Candidatus Saccharibacteria bacterium]
MKKPERPERIFYFDYLRILAMAAVMILHIAAQNLRSVPIGSFEWQTFNVVDSFQRWGVPVFVMISGALFLSKEQKIGKIFKKNILRLATAFLFWSLAYTLWQRFITHDISTNSDFVNHLIQGYGHLWFVPMIIGLYMISPILRKITENRRLAWYFVILSIIFSIIIPQTITIFSYKFNTLPTALNIANDSLRMQFVLGYSGYFVLGHLIHTADIKQSLKKYIYIAGVLSVFFTIFATLFMSTRTNELVVDFYREMTINVFAMSVAVFVFGKNHMNKAIKNKTRQSFVLFLSKCSFGMYLFHMFSVNILCYFFHFDSLAINPLLSIPSIFIITFVSSFVVSAIINKIPILNKYIV